jgi:ADP-heptose:LPS heptosyltransferase/SAM-dependent methyltransferase
MLDNQSLVSVLLLTEDAADDDVFNTFKNITEQTHKKIDIIVSTFRDDIDKLKERCAELHLDVRWAQQSPGGDFIGELLKLVDGEIVFYKTVNNCLWYPRHIEAHIESFNRDKGTKWALSHVENRNVDQHDNPFNTLSYRIDNPPHPDNITLDEICHYCNNDHTDTGIDIDWTACLVQKDDVPLFYPGYAIKQWIEAKYRGTVPAEITVIQWVKPDAGAPNEKELEDFYQQVGVPQTTEIKEEPIETDDGIEIKRVLPTVVGNRHFKEYTDSILTVIGQTEDINSIALKRSIGMGDVVITEPIVRKLKEKWPDAKLTFYTAKPDVIKYFKSQPDEVVKIDDNDVVKDTLHDTDNEIKFDLDLSYESREETSFIDAYAEVVNVKFDSQEDKQVSLVCDEDPLVNEKYVVVCGDGSGWPGKTWDIDNYAEVIKYIKTMGYKVYETGITHTEESEPEYHECDFDKLVNLIANCDFYVGTDNGPMHLARGFNRPCFIIAGAALPYYSTPNRKNIFYIQDGTHPGIGIKHKQFFNLTDQGLTFMPYFPDDPSCGLNNIKPHHVVKAINKFFDKPLSIIDNAPCDFYLNVSGNLVMRDVLPGFAYYKSQDTGIIQRENPYYHPDQRLDISQVYASDKNNIWINNFTPMIRDWRAQKGDGIKVLDVGCNMGILVEGANGEGFDIRGVDINKLSIKAGKEAWPKVAHLLEVSDYTQPQSEEGIYDAVVLSDILSHVGNPMALIKNVLRAIKDDGLIYINIVNFGCDRAEEEFHRWDGVGVGENITLYNRESFGKFADIVGIDYEDYRVDEEDEMMFLRCTKRG